jgi:hypothetical protein
MLSGAMPARAMAGRGDTARRARLGRSTEPSIVRCMHLSSLPATVAADEADEARVGAGTSPPRRACTAARVRTRPRPRPPVANPPTPMPWLASLHPDSPRQRRAFITTGNTRSDKQVLARPTSQAAQGAVPGAVTVMAASAGSGAAPAAASMAPGGSVTLTSASWAFSRWDRKRPVSSRTTCVDGGKRAGVAGRRAHEYEATSGWRMVVGGAALSGKSGCQQLGLVRQFQRSTHAALGRVPDAATYF